MAAKTSSETEKECSSSQSLKISKDLNFRRVSETLDLFRAMGTNIIAPENSNTHGFFDGFLRSFIKLDHIQRGRIACTLLVKGPICVFYCLILSSFSFFFFTSYFSLLSRLLILTCLYTLI